MSATAINEQMKVACVEAIAELAMAESSEVVAAAYGDAELSFGPDYLIPKPFDPRLIGKIAPAVAKAAMDGGVATRPIEDFGAYRETSDRFVFRSGMLMKPVFETAKSDPKRLVFAEGKDERVLCAVQVLIDDGLALPILLIKILGDGLPVGPMLLGAARPVHVVTPSVTGRGIVNISALAVVHAQLADEGAGMA